MKASALIVALQSIIDKHGDLPIIGGYMTEDSGFRVITLIDKNGSDAEEEKTKPIGIFLTN